MFKDPIGMAKQLEKYGRQLVVVIDPHAKIKDGYSILSELRAWPCNMSG